MRAFLAGLWAMKASLFGFVAAFALSFLSLGYISLALYGVVSPVLTQVYPPLSTWRGPWVWPVLVGVAILWSFSFLIAGVVDLRLRAARASNRTRWLAYLAILWLGALASWLVVLSLNWPE
ncbi:hypothetical protein ABIE41_003218 [Bosea sp. OAE506]|uniref:hypothetical protein n=1 Tax=Bosea sp. OAE506 TaxID=2663870 RepID=UPI00178AC243